MCFMVIVPATCEPALPAPVSMPAARFSSNDVGGATNTNQTFISIPHHCIRVKLEVRKTHS